MNYQTWEDVAKLPLEISGIFKGFYTWSIYSVEKERLLAINIHQRATKFKSKKKVEEFLNELNKDFLKHYDIKEVGNLYIDSSRDALLIRLVDHVAPVQQKKRVNFSKR